MAESVVSIVKGVNLDEMVIKALDHLGGIEAYIKPNSTVVVKPNAGHMGGPESSINTNPAVVAAVIKAVRKANPKKIILAESSAVGCNTMACLEVSGIKQAALKAGVDDIRDINMLDRTGRFFDVHPDQIRIALDIPDVVQIRVKCRLFYSAGL